MLRPSYSELMDILNQESDSIDKITSRYAIVIATAKRARQIINGAEPLTSAPTDKAVSIAVNEIFARKVHIEKEADRQAGVQAAPEVNASQYYGESEKEDLSSLDDYDGDDDDFEDEFEEIYEEDFEDDEYIDYDDYEEE